METKTAIITGGTGNLGRFIVNKFVDEGMKVYVPVQSIKKFDEIFNNSQTDADFKLKKIFAFECNAFDEKDVVSFVQKISALEKGKIDFLINTVGGYHQEMKVDNITTNDFEKYWRMNFLSTFFFSREVLKCMKENKFGRIISIGSMAGLQETAGRFPYSVSKSAIVNLMNTITEENKENNIKCNTIIPSVIDTPDNREWGSEEEIKKWVKPEEIADIIFEVVSEKFKSAGSNIIKVFGKY